MDLGITAIIVFITALGVGFLTWLLVSIWWICTLAAVLVGCVIIMYVIHVNTVTCGAAFCKPQKTIDALGKVRPTLYKDK